MLTKLSAFLLSLVLVGVAFSAPEQDSRRAQVDAATANAVEALRTQIGDTQLSRNLTVQDVLDRTHGNETLSKALWRAQQIGGPRWLDSQTCQVRLEISGTRVASVLTQIVTTNARYSPITPEYLSARLRDWDRRTFSATGTSTGAAAVEDARPRRGEAWASISDDARRQAVSAAKHDAIGRILESIRPIAFVPGKTVGDVLAVPSVGSAVEQWLESRPVTRVEFRDDLQVHVTLAAPADELAETFRAAASSQKQVRLPPDEPTWEIIRQDFVSRLSSTTGHGTAARPATAVEPVAIALPQTPPDWVNRQLDAEGTARPRAGSRLKSARAAEADAIAHLRSQVNALPLAGGSTLGEAAAHDPRLADAVSRALSQARTYKVDYRPDGSAYVRMTLDLREVWEAIRAPP
jgi:hypothetical protein